MSDGEKSKSKWVKVLDAAGLLDEIEDGWSLPPASPLSGATIEVRGTGGVPIPGDTGPGSSPPVPADAVRIVLPDAFARAATKEETLPSTPVEKTRSSGPAAPRSVEPPGMIGVSSAKETHVGLPRGGAAPSTGARKLQPTPLEIPPVTRERVVSRAVARISVQAESPGADERVLEAIIDEPAREPARPPLATEGPPRLLPLQRLRELYEVGDFTGALGAAEGILAKDPDSAEAARLLEECRRRLMHMDESRIGDCGRVPRVALQNSELIWRNLDPAAGFVLSRIDGFSTFEDVIDISGLPRFDTCRILDKLLQDGIIS